MANQRAKRWRDNNPEKCREARQKQRARLGEKEHLARRRAYAKAYRQKHPKRVNATIRKWYAANGEAARDGRRSREHVRRARWEGTATKEDLAAVRREANGLCGYCGTSTEKLEIDHFQPIAAGGRHDRENLVAVCRSCNRSKGALSFLAWLASGNADKWLRC